MRIVLSVNGSTLPTMVGAAIYVRVSTKEQTKNLSLPIQLRACEEYCRRGAYLHEAGRASAGLSPDVLVAAATHEVMALAYFVFRYAIRFATSFGA
jgi:hypothetical protein